MAKVIQLYRKISPLNDLRNANARKKRRGRDSNPWSRLYPLTGLANRRFRPLSHLSKTIRCQERASLALDSADSLDNRSYNPHLATDWPIRCDRTGREPSDD